MVTSESDEVLAKHTVLRDCQSSLVTSTNTFDLSLGVQGHGHGWQGSCSVLSDRSAYSSLCRTCVDGESTVELRTTRVLPVIPERLRMGRRRVTVGRVRITKTTSYRDVVVDELAAREEVHVRRVRVGRFVDGPVADRDVNGRLIVSILEVVPVVVRRLRVVEGLHIERAAPTDGETATARGSGPGRPTIEREPALPEPSNRETDRPGRRYGGRNA